MKKEIFNQYVNKIIEIFDVSRENLFAKSKRRDFVDARQLLYYLCFKRPMQLIYIQRYMEENGYSVSHPSIIHGIGVVEQKLAEDADYTFIIKTIEKSVTN